MYPFGGIRYRAGIHEPGLLRAVQKYNFETYNVSGINMSLS